MIHYPVYNKKHEIIAAAVTNLDIHDLGRLTATYGLAGLYIVTPLLDQQTLARRIIDYWIRGMGGRLNPDRAEALSLAAVVDDLDSVIEAIREREGTLPLVFATGAASSRTTISFAGARDIIHSSTPSVVLFGTGWGLTEETKQRADYLLDPITGNTGYNHLSVRSAAAIIVDRLLA